MSVLVHGGDVTRAILLSIALCASVQADARQMRSRAEVMAFQRHNVCPSTGGHRGACPGWQIDHVQSLCSGGPDIEANMQWLSVEEHRIKTRTDVRVCRQLRVAS